MSTFERLFFLACLGLLLWSIWVLNPPPPGTPEDPERTAMFDLPAIP